MTYFEFIKEKPTLYGSTTDQNYKQRIGTYQPCFNKYTNTMCYFFMAKNGRKTQYGFTLKRAFHLFRFGKLSTNPEKGNPDNYISYDKSPP
ncbi:hypothetical protein [Dysgonomonas sp. 25]|uniref:hypothetical protein n=1 Tax=Dysgonomonas sp. 25 TaxID=2302933 RepID=UPI0013D871FC|nr:hypothetical protein [Dysgonomonas sp. 25]NDV68637.1 hypothetical protein [Dysgonomonas sp. 25]